MFPGTLGNCSHVPQNIWETGTVPHIPQNIHFLRNWGTLFPKFLKRGFGNGNSSPVPQKCLGNRNSSPSSSNIDYLGNIGIVFPMFLKSGLGNILGNFGEQVRHKLVIKCWSNLYSWDVKLPRTIFFVKMSHIKDISAILLHFTIKHK